MDHLFVIILSALALTTEGSGRVLKFSETGVGGPDNKVTSETSGEIPAPKNPDVSSSSETMSLGSEPGQEHHAKAFFGKIRATSTSGFFDPESAEIDWILALIIFLVVYCIFLSILLLFWRYRSRQTISEAPKAHADQFCMAGRLLDGLGLMGGPGSCADCEAQLVQIRDKCQLCCKRVKEVSSKVNNGVRSVAIDMQENLKSKVDNRLEAVLGPLVEKAIKEHEQKVQ